MCNIIISLLLEGSILSRGLSFNNFNSARWYKLNDYEKYYIESVTQGKKFNYKPTKSAKFTITSWTNDLRETTHNNTKYIHVPCYLLTVDEEYIDDELAEIQMSRDRDFRYFYKFMTLNKLFNKTFTVDMNIIHKRLTTYELGQSTPFFRPLSHNI